MALLDMNKMESLQMEGWPTIVDFSGLRYHLGAIYHAI